ncbi:Uncharacterized protein TCM_044184 [Theobroma cacao]|uniref:Uncharacterized protein n=1 Tax=Theobroma cacao TaxID=3641 RepID=A0A061FRG3_THECC|nr:Uncharacterized protein TCM_044184 [Theobroma cacao]
MFAGNSERSIEHDGSIVSKAQFGPMVLLCVNALRPDACWFTETNKQKWTSIGSQRKTGSHKNAVGIVCSWSAAMLRAFSLQRSTF